jgi:hypothetical protein
MKEEEKKDIYELVQVPTQFGLAIKTPEGTTISEAELLVVLANELKEIRKNLG